MDLRPYQQAAVDAVWKHLREKDTNPCVVIATAGGKSICIAKIASDAVIRWGGRVIILAHVKELLEQNADKVRRLCPSLDVGLYSAGLDSRDTTQPVIIAGIQSVYNKADKLGRFDLCIIDEVHLLNSAADESMYRVFIDAQKKINPTMRVIGFTATPYRMKGGLICKPENVLNEICYEAGIRELIGQGYLSRITAKQGHLDANWDALHVRAGEFVAEDVEEAVNNDRAVDQSVRDMVNKAKDRKSIIVFCSSVSHCQRVAKQITQLTGEEVGVVTGDTPSMERAEILARFKREKRVNLLGEELPPLRWLCNMGVLTTGFDAPNIDCVALLRPTKSPGLFYQMAGRGLRLSPETGKTECRILDYGGNIARHGPLDCITVHESDNIHRNEPEKPHAKKCPECDELVHPAIMVCPACGYEWPKRSPELEALARNGGVLSGEPTDCEVSKVYYSVHEKKNAPPGSPRTMQVDYMEDLAHKAGSTWVCFEHPIGSYPRRKAERWWRDHCNVGAPMPMDAEDAVRLANKGALREVTSVTLAYFVGRKWPEVVGDTLEDPRQFEMELEPGSDVDVPPPPKHNSWDSSYDDLPF